MTDDKRRFLRRVSVRAWWTVIAASALGIATADERPRMIGSLPRTDEEMESVFNAAAKFACRPVAEGTSAETEKLSTRTTADVGLQATFQVGGRSLPIPMQRRAVVAVGMKMTAADEAKLPLISGGVIREYLAKHFVCLEVLVRRDLDTGALRLYDIGAAACLPCGATQLTERFEPLVRRSLENTRCLGFTADPKAPPESPPATLVFIVRNPTAAAAGDGVRTEMIYELLFVHAKPAAGEKDPRLDLHVFLTSDRRTKLHYLPAYSTPATISECGLVGTVVFTAYGTDGLTPADSALRSLSIAGTTTDEADLNRMAAESGGGAKHWLDCPPLVFESLIARGRAAK